MSKEKVVKAYALVNSEVGLDLKDVSKKKGAVGIEISNIQE